MHLHTSQSYIYTSTVHSVNSCFIIHIVKCVSLSNATEVYIMILMYVLARVNISNTKGIPVTEYVQ